MPNLEDTPKPTSPGDNPADQSDPSAASPTPKSEEEGYTVELVGFGPTFTIQGAIPPNPEDIEILARRQKHRLLWISLGLLVLALGISGLVLHRNIYREIKAHFAIKLARQAEDQVDKKQMDEAISSVRSAFSMSPDNPEVLRAIAKIISTLDLPGGMIYWNWLLETKEATDEDRQHAAEYALHQSLVTDASGIIQALLQKNGDDSKTLILASQLSSMLGDAPKAMAFATRASLDDPNNKAVSIFLAQLEIKNSLLHQNGIDLLFKMAEADDAFGLVALQSLAAVPDLKPPEIDKVIARLNAHPLADEADRLLALELEIKKDPSQRGELLKAAVAAHQNASLDNLRQFTNWLNTIDESARVLPLVSPEKAVADKGLFAVYLDALVALKKWGDLRAALSQNQVPLEPPYQQLYLSRWAQGVGDTRAEDLYWRGAVEAAVHNPRQSLALAFFAEKAGRNDRADTIYRLLTQEPVVSRLTYIGLLRVNAARDTQTLRDILDQEVAHWPMDRVAMDRDTYYNLLLKTRVQEMLQRQIFLVNVDPYSLYHRTNLALAYLRLNQPQEALKVYQNTEATWDQAPAWTVVVYAATLAANGQNSRARRIAHLVDWDTLRPEERALIKSIR